MFLFFIQFEESADRDDLMGVDDNAKRDILSIIANRCFEGLLGSISNVFQYCDSPVIPCSPRKGVTMFYFCDWFSLLPLTNPARTDKTLTIGQVSCHFWQGCSKLRKPTSLFSQAKISCSNLVPRVLSYPSLLSERETTGWKENLETRLTLFPFCTVLWVVRQVLFIISNVLHLYFLTIHKDILCKNRSEESLDYFHAWKSRKCSYERVRRTCDRASCGTKDWEKGMRRKLLGKKKKHRQKRGNKQKPKKT